MRLRDVMGGAAAGGLPEGSGADVEVVALAYDDREVAPGTLFFCVPGFTRDGHDFAAVAVERGAVALVVERPLGLGVPEVLVASARAAMGPAAARFHGDPTTELDVVGITGTNGKTTTAFLVRALLEAAGRQCGLLGTVTSFVGGEERPVQRTTAEALALQRDFAQMRDGGDVACAMEVSSHALELHRTDGTHFAVAVFTNLTQDHLDFHPTMEDYFAAKRRLFASETHPPARSVLNADDPYGARLIDEFDAGGTVRTYGIDADADYRAVELELGRAGSRFTLLPPEGDPIELRTSLPGRFNVSNALAAVAAVHALGVGLEQIAAALPGAGRVPGRFEPVDEGQGFAVVVDYAHTPDSLQNVLETARELTAGRVICVFGCGGDRDRGKRPLMGEIAARLADRAIVTSDNPRSEDPDAIVAEILAGTGSGDHVSAEVDRHAAIAQAIAEAAESDVVVIAGKGHEQGQELAGGRTIPFDDVAVAREALHAAGAAPR